VTPAELLEPASKALVEELDKVIHAKRSKFRTNKEVAEELGSLFRPSGDLYDGDLDPFDEIEAAEEAALMPEADEWMPDAFDKYLAAEVLLPHGGELIRAIEWKDGMTDWLPLKDLKESYPVQVAEYAVANKFAKQPAFAWWVP
jgi:hypothetical protein